MSTDIKVIRVDSPEQLETAWAIRNTVFVGEQGVTPAEEMDGLDHLAGTHHVLAINPLGEAVGTARMIVEPPGVVRVGRVAVLAHARGSHVGAALMHAVEQAAASEFTGPGGAVRIELSAQDTAIEFYRKLGYVIHPERYLDARIWHQDAHKVISQN